MYKQDIEISKAIAEIQNKTGWPKFVETALGKSKKVMEVIKILKGSLKGEVAIQSTDKEVLDQVKRKNVPSLQCFGSFKYLGAHPSLKKR